MRGLVARTGEEAGYPGQQRIRGDITESAAARLAHQIDDRRTWVRAEGAADPSAALGECGNRGLRALDALFGASDGIGADRLRRIEHQSRQVVAELPRVAECDLRAIARTEQIDPIDLPLPAQLLDVIGRVRCVESALVGLQEVTAG